MARYIYTWYGDINTTLYLNTSFSQINFHGQCLSSENIRVVSLGEGSFQLFQLITCESCAISALFSFSW